MIDQISPRIGWRGRITALKHIPTVLKIVWQSSPLLTILGLAFRALAALIPVSMLWISKLIIDRVVNAVSQPGAAFAEIGWLLVSEFGLACAGNVLTRTIDYCDSLLADKFTKQINVRVLEHSSKLDLVSFESPAFYDKLERARAQATDRIEMLSGMGRLGQQFVTLVSLSTGILLFSPWLLVLLVACLIPAFLGESHFAFLGYSLSRRLTPEQRQMDYFRLLGTSKETAKELKVFGLANYFIEGYKRLADRAYQAHRLLSSKRLWVGSLLAVLASCGHYGAYALVVYQTVQGRLTIGELTFLAGAIVGSSANIQLLFSMFSKIADQALFLSDLIEFFAVRPSIQSKPDAVLAPRPIRRGFEFRAVSFQYPDSDRRVLNNINLRFDRGEKVALVGENGQGKTTLIKLLARLYDPTEGAIFLDDIDLREYSIEDLSKEIGIIFQDFVRYEISARENIGVGRIDEISNELRVSEAARKSLADAVVAKLPNGLHQMLGRRFEGGADLSGGEWQKFALARAYMRDAQVLILDEPTASLDARSEYEVFQHFLELTQDCTAVLVSHRFSTVRIAQRILVLDDGQIREQGTHEQLLERGGRYAESFNLQAEGYR
jgi:ATP-binding cassette, subfamily B, bacterial